MKTVMKSNYRYLCKVLNPVFMAALIALSLVVGCKGRVDPILSEADFKMEEHPDSALMLLDSYRLSDSTSDYDRAYYGMLLTHARYKNFIDETNDSLINASSEYFLQHGDKKLASRSLFLQGMIQMNANRLGEAAVFFSKGLDIAKESKQYMWEGQCARGLFLLYGKLLNSSAQIKYAEEEYKAFSNGKCDSWLDYARLDLATAYNNNGQYERALTELNVLKRLALEKRDSMLLSEAVLLDGMSEFARNRFDRCLERYAEVYEMNPDFLTDDNKFHISVAQSMVKIDSLDNRVLNMLRNLSTNDCQHSFSVLADEGDYQDAYKALMVYKEKQEAVISQILDNDVSGSISTYQKSVIDQQKEKDKNKKLAILTSAIIICIIFALLMLWYRVKYYKSIASRVHIEAIMASLKADLLNQIAKNKDLSETVDKQSMQLATTSMLENKNESKGTDCLSDDSCSIKANNKAYIKDKELRKVLRDKYAEINTLCDKYYQGLFLKEDQKAVERKVKQIAKSFSAKSTLGDIEDYVDSITDNLYSSFKNEFGSIGEEGKKLFLFLMLNFSTLTICVLMDLDRDVVYNRKTRLKRKIKNSSSLRKDEYLKCF